MPRQLILGTHNQKKGEELAALVAPLGLKIKTLAEMPNAIEVVEDGDTFAKNAQKKAAEQAKHLGAWVLAEDSGLCVDALGGRPGVYSARYSGEGATDASNNRLLLQDIGDAPPEKRSAHYACYMALADSNGAIVAESSGRCGGRIRTEPAGANGFGYDPLFEVRELHRTFGELPAVVKSAISHRARAMRAILPRIAALVADGSFDE